MWEMQALNSQNATSNLTSAHDNALNGGCGNGLTTNGMSISSSGSSCSTGSTGSTTNGTMAANGPLSNGAAGLNGVVTAAQIVPNGVAGLGTGTNPSASVGVASELGVGSSTNNNNNNGSTQASSVVSELAHVTSSLTPMDVNMASANHFVNSIPTSDLEAQTLAFVESANAFLHPALRGVKAVSLARKRPLLGGPRSTMNPTKRTVMTLIARARTAQALHGSRTAQPIGEPIQVITSPLILQPPLDLLQPNASAGVAKENILQGA
uniref:Uncharacterized protein n=1 Tax=Anopheles epiroticus TaxID=199890 RepID=A0A182PWC9_9DIPT